MGCSPRGVGADSISILNHSLRFKAFAVASGALPQIIETTHWPGVAYSQDRIAIWIIFVFVVATMKSWRLDIEGTRNNFTNFANKDRWEDVMLDVILIQIFLASSASILLLFTYVTGYGDLMYVIFLALSLFHYSMQVEFANHYQVPERKFGMLHLIWALSLFVAYLVATGADTFFNTRGTESFTMRNWVGGVMHGFNLQLMILPATFMVFSLRYRSQCFARLKTSKGVQGHFSEYVAGHLFCASLLHSFLSTSHTCGSGERLKTPWTTYVC
jgi:hypothetical protein